MTILPLVTAFNNLELLTTPTKRYIFGEHTYEETEQLAKDMIESMYKYQGLGISANQLGLPYSVFAMRGPESDYICFNPYIAMPSEEMVQLEEACLSFPGMAFKLTRPRHLRIRFADMSGEVNSFTFANLTARIILHEMDHLNGRIFFEGTSRPTLERKLRQAKKRGFNYDNLGLLKYAGKS